ncbi:hypothetical protein SNEBB_003240 [Seison nebaliae]|nr:hypothetical protein SNEBB_003240 [Seison nebaliae]
MITGSKLTNNVDVDLVFADIDISCDLCDRLISYENFCYYSGNSFHLRCARFCTNGIINSSVDGLRKSYFDEKKVSGRIQPMLVEPFNVELLNGDQLGNWLKLNDLFDLVKEMNLKNKCNLINLFRETDMINDRYQEKLLKQKFGELFRQLNEMEIEEKNIESFRQASCTHQQFRRHFNHITDERCFMCGKRLIDVINLHIICSECGRRAHRQCFHNSINSGSIDNCHSSLCQFRSQLLEKVIERMNRINFNDETLIVEFYEESRLNLFKKETLNFFRHFDQIDQFLVIESLLTVLYPRTIFLLFFYLLRINAFQSSIRWTCQFNSVEEYSKIRNEFNLTFPGLLHHLIMLRCHLEKINFLRILKTISSFLFNVNEENCLMNYLEEDFIIQKLYIFIRLQSNSSHYSKEIISTHKTFRFFSIHHKLQQIIEMIFMREHHPTDSLIYLFNRKKELSPVNHNQININSLINIFDFILRKFNEKFREISTLQSHNKQILDDIKLLELSYEKERNESIENHKTFLQFLQQSDEKNEKIIFMILRDILELSSDFEGVTTTYETRTSFNLSVAVKEKYEVFLHRRQRQKISLMVLMRKEKKKLIEYENNRYRLNEIEKELGEWKWKSTQLYFVLLLIIKKSCERCFHIIIGCMDYLSNRCKRSDLILTFLRNLFDRLHKRYDNKLKDDVRDVVQLLIQLLVDVDIYGLNWILWCSENSFRSIHLSSINQLNTNSFNFLPNSFDISIHIISNTLTTWLNRSTIDHANIMSIRNLFPIGSIGTVGCE